MQGALKQGVRGAVVLTSICALMTGCAGVSGKRPQAANPSGTVLDTMAEQEVADLRQTRYERLADLGPKELLTAAECAAWPIEPSINSVGSSAVLTFDPEVRVINGRRIGPRAEILIEGRDLYLPGCVDAQVTINGAIDASADDQDYYVSSSSNGDTFSVILNEQYLSRLQTGDRVEVLLTVSTQYDRSKSDACLAAIEAGKPGEQHRECLRVVHYGSREFNVYTLEDYRNKVQANRIDFKNLHAFPLPDAEVDALFGSTVSDNFYVVKLSVRNDTGEDRLITSGMIRASGRVMVEPEERGARYTLPVQLAPHSLEQVYEILDKQEAKHVRSVVFRSLEFIGSLATAASLAFGGSTTMTESLGIFTGVAIPEGKRLWPNGWAYYKSNVVQFAMQDLAKIPNGSVMNQKLLFFPKNSISGLISDPYIYGDFERAFSLGGRRNFRPVPPKAAIISVAFDSLDIPFENVFTVEAKTFEERVADNALNAREILDQMEFLQNSWVQQQVRPLFDRLAYDELQKGMEPETGLPKLIAAIDEDIPAACEPEAVVAEELAPAVASDDGAVEEVPDDGVVDAAADVPGQPVEGDATPDGGAVADDGQNEPDPDETEKPRCVALTGLKVDLGLALEVMQGLKPAAVKRDLLKGAKGKAGERAVQAVEDRLDTARKSYIRGASPERDLGDVAAVLKLARARLVFYESSAAIIETLLKGPSGGGFLLEIDPAKIGDMTDQELIDLAEWMQDNVAVPLIAAHENADLVMALVPKQ